MKIRISEFGVAVGDRVEGTVRDGNWTPQMQADYYGRFFMLCCGHPAVEAVNIMGIGDTTWRPGQGLLDAGGNPAPAFNQLKQLITESWRTQHQQAVVRRAAAIPRFPGSYELTLSLPGGKTATAAFNVTPLGPERDPVSANKFRFCPWL